MGLLNTIETILAVMGDKPEVRGQLEQAVLNAVVLVLTGSHMEFYEEAFSLICDLTTAAISPAMWQAFQGMVTVFENDGKDYFTDMMPALHNYVTVDTAAFLANQQYPMAMYKMCRHILLDYEAGEDPECHAAKLLEVIILQCREQINQMIPAFLETVFVRLSREIKTSELRTMCLQVAIAALIHDNTVFYAAIESTVAPALNQDALSVVKNFVGLWINDSDCFIGIHDRKISVLGLCRLITLLPQNQTTPWQEHVPQIMPSLIMLFKGLKGAYEARKEAEEDEDSSDEEEDSDLDDVEALDSDEDEIDEDSAMYLESLQQKLIKHTNGTVNVSIFVAISRTTCVYYLFAFFANRLRLKRKKTMILMTIVIFLMRRLWKIIQLPSTMRTLAWTSIRFSKKPSEICRHPTQIGTTNLHLQCQAISKNRYKKLLS